MDWLGITHTASAASALFPARTWIEWHYMSMCWSYVGLCAAALAEFLTRLPYFWPQAAALAPGRFF